MKINWLSLLTMLITIMVLNIWKISEIGSINYYLSTFIAFGLMGWWWKK